jgi:hypothetical protein
VSTPGRRTQDQQVPRGRLSLPARNSSRGGGGPLSNCTEGAKVIPKSQSETPNASTSSRHRQRLVPLPAEPAGGGRGELLDARGWAELQSPRSWGAAALQAAPPGELHRRRRLLRPLRLSPLELRLGRLRPEERDRDPGRDEEEDREVPPRAGRAQRHDRLHPAAGPVLLRRAALDPVPAGLRAEHRPGGRTTARRRRPAVACGTR